MPNNSLQYRLGYQAGFQRGRYGHETKLKETAPDWHRALVELAKRMPEVEFKAAVVAFAEARVKALAAECGKHVPQVDSAKLEADMLTELTPLLKRLGKL